VDTVCVFSTDEELRNIIKQHNPYSMVKGSDYKNKPIIGKIKAAIGASPQPVTPAVFAF
jgi:bifunctional ADP-heptose synthase (sugar kinase/adenylyltransferase)